MAILPKPAELGANLKRIYAHYERHDPRHDERRGYLGASEIGLECERRLWYRFRWAGREKKDGRIRKLLETGDREESRMVDLLRAIGCEVINEAEGGGQIGICDFGGHFRGHLDGVGRGFEPRPQEWAVTEFKTSNAKNFAAMRKDGVKKAKPEHWAQMQTYMHAEGLSWAVYFVTCKDDDNGYEEWIAYNPDAAEALMAKAGRIIRAEDAPPKVSDNPDSWSCRYCEMRDLCHGLNEPPAPAVVAEMNCRTCCHATPVIGDSSAAMWRCERHNATLAKQQQEKGCRDHVFIPDFVTFATVKDGDKEANWIEYDKNDGSGTFRNGTGHYASDELTTLPAPLIAADAVLEEIKVKLGGRVVEMREAAPKVEQVAEEPQQRTVLETRTPKVEEVGPGSGGYVIAREDKGGGVGAILHHAPYSLGQAARIRPAEIGVVLFHRSADGDIPLYRWIQHTPRHQLWEWIAPAGYVSKNRVSEAEKISADRRKTA